MSKNRGKCWYAKAEYNDVQPARVLADGSTVEVVADPDETHPEARKLIRTWPDKQITTVRFVPGGPFSNKLYLTVDNDRACAGQSIAIVEPPLDEYVSEADRRRRLSENERTAEFEEALANGELRQHVVNSPVPGNRRGDTLDRATGLDFRRREDFEKEYQRQKIARLMRTDMKNMNYGTPKELSGKWKFGSFPVDSPNSEPPGLT